MIERGVLYVVDGSSNSVKQHVAVLLKYLNRARYQPCLVISNDANVAERLRDARIQYGIIPEIASANKFSIAGTVNKIEEFARKYTINLVHSHDYQGCFVGAQIAKQLGVSHVSTIYKPTDGEEKKKGFFVSSNEKIVSMPDYLIAVSEEVKLSLGATNNVTLIHNAIEADRFAETLDTERLQRELELDKDDYLIGTVTNLTTRDEADTVFKVADALIKNNSKIHFVIAGQGPGYESFKKRVKKLPITKNVHYLGYRRDVAHMLKSLNVVLIANKRPGIPLILLESLASARPVVAVDTPGIREVVSEESAKFVKAGDVKAMVTAIEYMITHMDEAAIKATAGHKVVTEIFNVEQMLKSTQSLYLQIAG